MPSTVLPQLKTIESNLSSREAQLTTELAAVREKLSGLQAVMSMFESKSDTDASIPSSERASSSEETSAPVETTTAVSPKRLKGEKTAQKKATAGKKTTTKKKDGRTASWQKYMRPGVKNESIPEAVKLVLATQPEKDFKIAEVMDALFVEDMPKSQYLKARNRISNVLSDGVRAGDWFKGARSSYRMTAA